jgi:hypothetical protein
MIISGSHYLNFSSYILRNTLQENVILLTNLN